MSELGERLRSRRIELGLTVSEVARRSGVNRTYLQRLEGSDRNVRVSAVVIHRLAATLQTSPYDLLPELVAEGGQARESSPLVEAVRQYLASVDEPDPRLVGRLATLPGHFDYLTVDEVLVASEAQRHLFSMSSESMIAELKSRLPELGAGLAEALRARRQELPEDSQSAYRLRLLELIVERLGGGSVEPMAEKKAPKAEALNSGSPTRPRRRSPRSASE